MYPVLLSIAGFHFTSFSIFFILAWSVFSFVFWKSLREEGVGEEQIFDLTFYGTLAALVSARLVFVVFHWDQFSTALLKIAALWVAPGLSLLGAIIASLSIMVLLGKRMKVRVGAVLDAFSLALPGAFVVGMVGSLLDGTVVGRAANVPWAIHYVGLPESRHPFQVYEIIAMVLILGAIGWMTDRSRKKKWALGGVGIGFFLLWSLEVFALEFFKDAGVYWNSLTANQWAAIILFSMAVGAWYVYAGGKRIVRGVVTILYAKFPKRRS